MHQEAFQVKWVKVPPIQSLASRIVPILARKRITANRSVDKEDTGWNLRVNGLNPEIVDIQSLKKTLILNRTIYIISIRQTVSEKVTC